MNMDRTMGDIVHARRATPAFSSDPVAEADLERILRAGLEAPSSYNLQPWRFVVVRDPAARRRLREAALGQDQVEQAPVVIVACGDPEAWRDDLELVIAIGREHGIDDESRIDRKRHNVAKALNEQSNMPMWVTKQTMIAATTMMWMAESLGYDTGPMEGFDEGLVREALGIPDRVRVVFLLAVGRLSGDDGRYPGRLPVSRTLFVDRYGEPSTP